ncbi:MAG: Orn/Lys/Arg decarboxylase N-terminal domain-containing protein, partial [Pseudomonadota bacterium]
MYELKDFPVLVIDHDLHTDNGGGRAMQEIMAHLKGKGYNIIESLSAEDAVDTFKSHTEISCVLVDWDLGDRTGRKNGKDSKEIVHAIRERNDKIPIFIVTERHKVQDIPTDILSQVQEYVWKMEDTPEFIAGKVTNAAKGYITDLMPIFFKSLVKYTNEYKYAWHTPGHMGGLAFLKSPAGRIFFDFFGENVFRADLSVSVPEMGSLMEHAGVEGLAEVHAAKNFNADFTFFVTNGTSTANKIVMNSCVTPGDIVLVDRNCHKSLQHAITMTGAVPIYLIPSRNAYGIIGGIHVKEFDEKTIKQKIMDSPLIRDKKAKIKLSVVTNSTYDGLIYNVVTLKNKLKNLVENMHFDEAWYAYANFHPIYDDRYAMCSHHNERIHPAIYATQSTHKLLASFSQASMVHVKSGVRKVDRDRFNEAFMMHTSTSPQYSIIASLDVASKMMEGVSGRALIQDAIDEAIVFRKKMVQIREEMQKDKSKEDEKWFFSTWQPDQVYVNGKLGRKKKKVPFLK